MYGEYENTGADHKYHNNQTENGSRKIKRREPLWLPYLSEQHNIIHITMPGLCNLMRTTRYD